MLSLKNVMRANAISCLLFGVLFVIAASQVTTFLSDTFPAPEQLISMIGVALIINGLHLIWASNLLEPSKLLLIYFSAGDYIWTAASLIIIASGRWITTSEGVIVTIIIGVIVATLGTLQLKKIQ